jgi:hypothetical protein
MRMIFGLDFKNDTGEAMQFAVNSETEEVLVRVTRGGTWRPWRRIDVKRTASGELDETVGTAKRAETADRLTTPVRLNFVGAVTGTATLDGATRDLTINLSIDSAINNAISAAVASAISSHVRSHHSSSGGGGRDR